MTLTNKEKHIDDILVTASISEMIIEELEKRDYEQASELAGTILEFMGGSSLIYLKVPRATRFHLSSIREDLMSLFRLYHSDDPKPANFESSIPEIISNLGFRANVVRMYVESLNKTK